MNNDAKVTENNFIDIGRILVVDDEEPIRNLVSKVLQKIGFEIETAEDGFEALAKIELDVDLVLTDIGMPGLDGYEVIQRMRSQERFKSIPIVVLTAFSTREDRLKALRSGADDFITKPIDNSELQIRIKSLMERRKAVVELENYKKELEGTVERRTLSLRKSLEEVVTTKRMLREAHYETIKCLVTAAEFKDKDTADHIRRMSQYCALIAKGIRMSPSDVELMQFASPMHDVGKIGVPDEILMKPDKLEKEEWPIIQNHTKIGYEILKKSESTVLEAGRIIALSHHEKWDGSGYPQGLEKSNIPLQGRICAIADVFDALTSVRPYKKAFPNSEAFDLLSDGAGKHFDPDLVGVFENLKSDIVRIQQGKK